MKNTCCFLILFLSLTSLNPTKALAEESMIFNFSSKKVYYNNHCTAEKGKVRSFSKEIIEYSAKRCKLTISRKPKMKDPICILTVNDKKDVFITGDKLNPSCALRAERLPKEY